MRSFPGLGFWVALFVLVRLMTDMTPGTVVAKAVMLLAHHRATLCHGWILFLRTVIVSIPGVTIHDAAMRRNSRHTLMHFLVSLTVQTTCLGIGILHGASSTYAAAVMRCAGATGFHLWFCALLRCHSETTG